MWDDIHLSMMLSSNVISTFSVITPSFKSMPIAMMDYKIQNPTSPLIKWKSSRGFKKFYKKSLHILEGPVREYLLMQYVVLCG